MKRRFTILTAALALLVSLAIPMGVWGQTRATQTVSYGWETTDDATQWAISDAIEATQGEGNTGTYAGRINTNSTTVQFNEKVYVTSFSYAFKRTSNNNNYSVYIETSSDGSNWSIKDTQAMNTFTNGTYRTVTKTFDGTQELYVRFRCNNTTAVRYVDDVTITYNTSAAQLDPCDLTLTNASTSIVFDLYNNSDAYVINYTTSSTGLVTVSDSDYITTVVDQTNKTITVTPVAVTNGAKVITVNQAADDNYAAGSKTFTINITDSTPFTGGDVTFVAGTDIGTTSTTGPDSMTKQVVTVSSTSAAFATAEYRLYSGSETTISTSFGTITQIEFTKNGSYSLGNLSTETGNYTSTTGIWTGDAQEVTFSAAAQVRLDQINVTITSSSSAIATTTEITVPIGFNTDLHVSTTAGTLSASVTETESGNAVSGATVTWSSSNTDVATIDANGVVTLVAAGTTTIIASYAGVTDQYRPSSDTYELVVTDSTPIGDLVIDFESATTAYTNWTFTNMTSHETSSITAHGGTYYGTTGGKETASITTKSKIATPYTLTCYVSKQSNNTTASTWYIQVSTDGSTWTNVESRSATDMSKGEWKEFTANLSSYTNVYVRVYYDGTTAVRNIDDLTLLTSVPSVIAPTFSPAEGLYTSAQNVTISTTTSGATIYYTLDGTDPTTSSSVYSSPINVSSTTTIKAMAVASGNQSSIVSATYTIELPLSTMDQIFAKATEVGSTPTTVHITLGDWVVTGANTSSHTFVSDGTKGFMIYGSNHGFSAGDVLSGTVECKVQLYNGAAEITQLNSTTTGLTVTPNGTVTVANITLADLAGINTGALVSYQNLICEERVEGDYTNYYLSDGTTEIQAYKTLLNDYADYLEDGKTYNITGVFVLNNSTKRINPRNAADIEEVHTLTIPGYAAGSAGGYRLIASPVTVSPSDVQGMILTGADAVKYDLFYFDQAKDKEWINYKGDASTGNPGGFSLVPGKGYLYAKEATTENQTYTFELTGIPYNNEPIILSKSESGDFPGWNLVGNPFGETAYIGNRSFYVMNEDGSDLMESSGAIAPMKGIFVIAANDGEELQFTKSSTAGKSSRLGLTLSNGRNVIDRATVRFDEGDELPKFQLNKNHTKVYFSMDGEDYAVVRGEEMGAMPVNFKAENNGSYTLSVNAEEVSFAYLHLIDNMTGADVDLLQTPSYSFEAKTTDYESRFKLVFATGDNSNDDTFAFYSNGSFVINNEGNATLQVIDIMGRIVKSESINGCANVSVNGAAGVYMLRLVNGDNVKTQKVVVK